MKTIITGTYDLVPDDSWRLGQLQEIYLQCDTTLAPVTINLFEIADLENFWNVKIFVTDIAGNAFSNNITINSIGADSIDFPGTTTLTLNTNGASVELQVVSDIQWFALESNSGVGTVQSVTGLNTNNTDPANPIVQISVDGSTITGTGTPINPLVSKMYSVLRTNIKQAAILTLGSTPVEILGAAAAGKVRLIAYIDIWFDGTLYGGLNFQNYLEISQAGIPTIGVNRVMIGYPGFGSTSKQNYLRVYPGTGLYADPSLYVQPNDLSVSGAVTIKMAKTIAPFFTDPTGGGGGMNIDVYYTEKLFNS